MKKARFSALLFAVVLTLSVFTGCEKKSGTQTDNTIRSLDELKGEKVAVLSGSVFDKIIEREAEGCLVQYVNSNTDLGVMLDTDKVKAYITDEPTTRLIFNTYPDQIIMKKISDDNYGFFFKKNDEKGSLLCSQMNEFLSAIRKNGTMKQIDDIWFGSDTEKQTVDMSGLTAENGTLKMALTTTIGMPFAYMKDNRLVGYDVDIAVRFCREYGYGIEFVDGAFSTMLLEVSGGKCDFGASCVTITDERKESVLFSEPDYYGSTVVVVKDKDYYEETRTLKDFEGKKIAVLTGSVFDVVAREYIKNSTVDYFNSYTDMAATLISGKADGMIIEALSAMDLLKNHPQLTKLAGLRKDDYGIIFNKSTEKGKLLCGQMNDFLAELKADGTLDEMKESWESSNDGVMPETGDLTGENGKLIFAISSNIGAPFTFIRDGEYVGYEVELAYRFCIKYGYGIEFIDSDFNGILANVESGKADFGAGSISITKERSEKMLFSDPD
ncbi:MAG: transporter substrate-binding domain-containing protein, partial [Firmicutes bacterium]|nr:transporter substrate-binding domain-containing protein [Candidatus Colimorpha enterica]